MTEKVIVSTVGGMVSEILTSSEVEVHVLELKHSELDREYADEDIFELRESDDVLSMAAAVSKLGQVVVNTERAAHMAQQVNEFQKNSTQQKLDKAFEDFVKQHEKLGIDLNDPGVAKGIIERLLGHLPKGVEVSFTQQVPEPSYRELLLEKARLYEVYHAENYEDDFNVWLQKIKPAMNYSEDELMMKVTDYTRISNLYKEYLEDLNARRTEAKFIYWFETRI